jgi:hypothetical protein
MHSGISGERLTLVFAPELTKMLVEDFLKNSWPCVEAIVAELATFKEEPRRKVSLFYVKNSQRNKVELDGRHFFLRTSVEYANPQLTVEEVQGIVAARLLEACGNYFHQYGLHQPDQKDKDAICELLKKPSQGSIVPFLLITDDVEPDRYSINPLRESIVNSGQSAFPAAKVRKENLEIDKKFVEKYEDSLVCRSEVERIARFLDSGDDKYVDLVDAAKFDHLESLSNLFGINLSIYAMRMPLAMLEKEKRDGLLHFIVGKTHSGYDSVERVYQCMGRSMKNLTTLLTVPHSQKGYGSKRAARGRLYFEGKQLKKVKVSYRTTLLYENEVDPSDVSVAKADDSFSVEGERLTNYDFRETPSSPQFFLYSLASPEDAALWHGIGVFGAAELLKSYTTTRLACTRKQLISDLKEKYGIAQKIPLQFNLLPKYMWCHPTRRNIDASIGCIKDFGFLTELGMKMEFLPSEQYIRA